MKFQSNPFFRPARFVAAFTLTTCLPVTFAVITLCASIAYGQSGSRTWTGAVDGNFYNGANWDASGNFPNGIATFSGTTANSTITRTGNAYDYVFGLTFGNTLGSQSSFTFSSGGTQFFWGGPTISTAAVSSGSLTDEIGVNVVLGGGSAGQITKVFDINSNHHLRISGNITGGDLTSYGVGYSLTKNGAGTLIFSGTNTYTATTTVTAGTLFTTKAAALSGYNSAGRVIFNGGTLGVQVAGSGWTPGEVDTLLANATKTSGIFAIDTTNGDFIQGAAFTFGGLGLTKLGTNTLTLGQANTYTGVTTVNAGTLSLGHATDTLSSSSAVTVDGATAVLAIAGNSDTVGAVSLKNGGSITGTGGTLTGASYAVESGSVSANLGGASIALTKSTAGTVTLTGAANTYGGTTTVSAGTLNLSGNLTTVGQIKVNGASGTVLDITGNLTQTVGGVRNFQLGATAGNSGTVNVSGSGILTLGNGMMLGENNGGNGTMNVSGGTVTTNGETWFSGANSILNVSGGTFNASGTTRMGGGSGTTSSTLTVSGTGSYIGATLDFGNGGANATSTVNIGNGSVGGNLSLTGISRSSGTNTINFDGGTLTANAGFTVPTLVATVVKSGGAFINVAGVNGLTIGGGLTDGSGGGGLTKSGTGTLSLSGANTYTGATTLNQGTLTFGTGTLATTTGALSVNNTNTTAAGNAAILNLSTAANTTTGSLSGSISTPTTGTNTATINTQTSRTLTVNQTAAGTYAGVIAGTGNFALGSLSTNTLTLSGTNTYNGTTTINVGTLALGHATDTLSSSSAVTVDGATAVLAIGGNNDTVGAVSLKNGGSITGTGGTLTGASYAVESGSISANLAGGSIALTKSTAGTVTLSGTNTYSGNTTISEGKLLFSRGASNTSDYAGTGGYSIASGATLEINGTGSARFNTSNNQFTGAGTFIKSGNGRTFLTAGSNTQSFNMSAGGLIDVQAGILDTSAQATNLAALNIVTGAQLLIAHTDSITTLQFDALTGGGTLNMVAAANRTVVIGANGGSGTFSGVISNTGTISLTKTGAGTQTLSGANTYTGPTAVNGGTLKIDTTGTINGTSGISIGAGEFNYNNSTTALSPGVSFSGTGGTLSGTGTITQAVTVTTGNRQTAGSSVTTANPAAILGKETFTNGITYNTGSIFEWNLTGNTDTTLGTRGTNYDAVNTASLGSTTGAIFRVILNGTQNFSESFWDTNRTWADIFKTGDAGSNLSIASIFSAPVQYYNSAGVLTTPTAQGSFTISGTSLSWAAVPEPTSALAGLLLGAGLLRRRRNA